MSNINPIKAYKETNIKTAGQNKLIVMLYDEAIKQLDNAINKLSGKSKELDLVNNSILKAQDIITELMASLNFEKGKDIARNLFSLYLFFNHQLMEANVQKDIELIKQVRKMLSEIRASWAELVSKGINKENASPSRGINIAG